MPTKKVEEAKTTLKWDNKEAHPTTEINLLSYVVHECMVGDCDKLLFSENFKKIEMKLKKLVCWLLQNTHC